MQSDHTETLPDRPGTYALVLRTRAKRVVEVGALGPVTIHRGFYIYVGSALGSGGLRARIQHHETPSLRPHWHIDYLRRETELVEIWYAEGRTPREHRWAGAMARGRRVRAPFPGFGSSDCDCSTHLFACEEMPSRAAFRRRLAAGSVECVQARSAPARDPPELAGGTPSSASVPVSLQCPAAEP